MDRRNLLRGVAGTAAALVAKPALATWPFHPGGAFNPDINFTTYFNVVAFGAIGDGASHPASGVYGSLAALQVAYPFATALTNEINWLAFQAALNAADAAGGATVFVPYGVFVMANSSSPLDGSGTLHVGDYSLTVGNTVNILGSGGRWGGSFNAASELAWPTDLGKPAPATFTGSIATTTLTASSVTNSIIPGMWVRGSTSVHTKIIQQLTGTPNGAGTYKINNSQTVGSTSMTADFTDIGNPSGRRSALTCGNTDDTFTSNFGYIQDIWLNGPGVGSTIGVATASMIGLYTCDKTNLFRISSSGFYAGMNVVGGQTEWQLCNFQSNFYGAYWQQGTQEFGDMVIERCSFSQNNMAGWGVAPAVSIVTTVVMKSIFDAQPFGIYKEPWTPTYTASIGFGPTNSFNTGAIIYDMEFIECQFENIGNAAVGDGLFVTGNFTGSIAGTTLTTSGSPNLQVGQFLSQVGGGPAIAVDTFITAIGGANTFTVSVSQTVASGTIGAFRPGFVFNTRFEKSQMGWWQSGGGGSGLVLAGKSAAGLISCGNCFGLTIVEPVTTFQWAPGSDAIFDISTMAGGVGIYTPSQGFKIEGDISTLITNCITGPLGGHGFFSNAAFITPGFTEISNTGSWKGEATNAPGFGAVTLGSVVNYNTSGVTLCAGTPSDNPQGILVFQGTWGLVANRGIVNVASGANVISSGQYVRTAAGGTIIGATGASDTTSKVIGYATAGNSGGVTPVKLLGLN